MSPNRQVFLHTATATLVMVVFAADWFTPLGWAVWILYILPVTLGLAGRSPSQPIVVAGLATAMMTLTLFTDPPGGLPMAIHYTNRAFGVAVVWVLAFMVRAIVEGRNRNEAEEWVRGVQARLLEQMQGDPTVQEIAERSLATLCEMMDATIAALYASDGTTLRLAATRGLREGADVPAVLEPNEGIASAAVARGEVVVLDDVPPDAFPLRSAFVGTVPRYVAVVPLVADRLTEGIIELGLPVPPGPAKLDALTRIQYGVAIAIRTATYRARVRALLTETQQQAESLRQQQEELRVTNEELEEHSRALRASQARLEEQQAELEASNAQLEAQTEQLEQQKASLMAAREEAERASRYKSEFLANMSHELRTPLNSTLILARLLAQNKGGRLSEEEVRYAETIYASGTHLLALINDILDLSKIEAGAATVNIERVELRALLRELEQTFAPQAADRPLAFEVHAPPGLPDELRTDGQRLRQILLNLLSNAFKFTEQGRIGLYVKPHGGDRIAFEVRDTGPGIPRDQHQAVFEAFRQADGSTQRRHGGTGLGLSISLQLARLLGGDIELESTPGVGSIFTVILPVELRPGAVGTARARVVTPPRLTADGSAQRPSSPSPAAVAEPAKAADAPAPVPAPRPFDDDRDRRRHPGRLILVVEDDPTFARILYDTAHSLDFDCVVATTTDEGMTLARSLSPSGILLDIQLPDGSGLMLLDRLKRNPDTRHIPVHVIAGADHSQTALALGAIGYAIKPVDTDELVEAIRRLEARLEARVRRVLVVEDDPALRASLVDLLRQLEEVQVHAVGTGQEALTELAGASFDCVILDLRLPDASGFDVLETMSASEQYSFPPVIIYTGGPISEADEERLRQYSRSVIVKGARSPERLLAEVTLFLHQVESRLPPAAQRLLKVARERDELFEGRTILVVEDDVRNVFALTSVFEPLGARVRIARNGVEALRVLDETRPDLVLMDIMMPEMDGLTAMREIRRRPELGALPIIALTAKAMPDDYEQCLAAGASDYLAKPLDVDKLVSLCRVWLSRG